MLTWETVGVVALAIVLFPFLVMRMAWTKWRLRNKSTDVVDQVLFAIIYLLLVVLMAVAAIASIEENWNSKIHTEQGWLSPAECGAVIEMAEAEALARGSWSTSRHKYYPTTDLNCFSIVEPIKIGDTHEVFGSWWNRTHEPVIFQRLSKLFDVPQSQLYMKDLFVVKYDMAGQRYLPEHQDSSQITFNIALSKANNDYKGGGSRFVLSGDVINVAQGDALIHDSGLFHAGHPISSGTRYILIGFVNVRRGWYTWYRIFGSVATCLSEPLSAISNLVGEHHVRQLDKTICRSWLWLMYYIVKRPITRTAAFLTGRQDVAHDPAGGVQTDDSFFDLIFGIIFFVLVSLLIFLCIVVGCIHLYESRLLEKADRNDVTSNKLL